MLPLLLLLGSVQDAIYNAATGTLSPRQREQQKAALARDIEQAGGTGLQVASAQREYDKFVDDNFRPRFFTPEAAGVSVGFVALAAGGLLLFGLGAFAGRR
jgi:hypothetical protein